MIEGEGVGEGEVWGVGVDLTSLVEGFLFGVGVVGMETGPGEIGGAGLGVRLCPTRGSDDAERDSIPEIVDRGRRVDNCDCVFAVIGGWDFVGAFFDESGVDEGVEVGVEGECEEGLGEDDLRDFLRSRLVDLISREEGDVG